MFLNYKNQVLVTFPFKNRRRNYNRKVLIYWNEKENMLSFSLNQVAGVGDRLARPITSVSTFNIRFTAFFIAVPTTRDQSKFLSSPLFHRALSCPNTKVGVAGWDLSLLIQYRYLPTSYHSSLATFHTLAFELFRFHDLQLTIIDRRTT